jgi:hypothetical protein
VDRTGLTRGTVAAASLAACAATAHTAYNLRVLRTPSTTPPPVAERVSVLVPARDEAGRITPCITALLASVGVPDLEVLVLDDGSTDGTAEVVRAAAAGDPRVRVLDGGRGPLPRGWLGKPWACARLAEEASGSVLVFLDADVELAPHGIAATVALLRGAGLAAVSPYPHQQAHGVLPRLVQPLLQWSWATTLPLRLAETSPRESLVAANGQLLAVDAEDYRAAGGHAAVRDLVLEDIGLLRALKRAGRRGVAADGTDVASCRMYDSAGELVDGYAKSLWSAFGSPAGSAAVVGGLSFLYVVPALAGVAARDPRTRAWGTLGYAAGVTGRALVAHRTRTPVVPDALAHPVSVLAFGALVAESWRRKRTGRLGWRGRRIP